jgi:hypothetical protein
LIEYRIGGRVVVGLKLEQVVPWGRSLAEYRRMFDLQDSDLNKRILDCAGGPASFNAEMTAQGYHVIACDPVYQFDVTGIQQRITDTYDMIIAGVKANIDSYVWQEIQSPEQLGEVRMAAMEQFLADFPLGLQQGRYINAELPQLPFASQSFDLVLCSHLLFTYSDQLSLPFHYEAIRELLRIASEVRIFPVLNISGELSPWLSPVMEKMTEQGYQAQLKTVPYEFQKGGNQMLQILSLPSS